MEGLAQRVYQLPKMRFNEKIGEDGILLLTGRSDSYGQTTTVEVKQTGNAKLEIARYTP